MRLARQLCGLVFAVGGVACGGAHPQTQADLVKVQQRLDELTEAHQAQSRRIAYLKDRMDLMKDELEARAMSQRGPAIPAGLPVVQVRPLERPAPVDPDEPPPTTITQADVERLSPRRDAGPRGPVEPPANAAGAGNIGVLHMPPAPVALGAAAPLAPPRTVTMDEPPADDAVAAYKAAYKLHQRGESGRASAAFAAFVANHPGHAYADNALYWLGESRFNTAQYRGALEAFRRVLQEHPTGNKVPDALYMIGLTMNKLGRPAEGRETLARLVAMYPDTKAARRAARDISANGQM